MKHTFRHHLRRAVTILAVCASLAGGWAGYLHLTGNFHAVEPGVVYRSGQLSEGSFKDYIKSTGIRTVVNLRGNNAGVAWYDEEIKAVAGTDVTHIDFPLSSGRELSDRELGQLTAILRNSAKPVLIHCQGGADRTGLASALYELIIAKRDASDAASQLSFRYGHFPWLRSHTAAMDRSFARALEIKGRLSSGSFD